MSKVYSKEELKALTIEDFNAMTVEERAEVQKQGKAFYLAELGVA